MTTTALDQILAYHEQTKHRSDRYARSLGFMEWASQPCPFRNYEGSERIELDFHPRQGGLLYDELLDGAAPEPEPLSIGAIGSLLRDSLALSAWKRMDGRSWPLRVVPSSGNLHPSEAYLMLPAVAGIGDAPALYHYAPYQHALERRRLVPAEAWQGLTDELPAGSFLMGLSSIFWRESWKYGERAFRYCQHDLGHLIAALDCSARLLGWHVRLQSKVPRELLERLLAIDGQSGPEKEHGACLLAVVPIDGRDVDKDPRRERLEALAAGAVEGTANRLSPYHHDWPIIDTVVSMVGEDDGTPGAICPTCLAQRQAEEAVDWRSCSARQIIHQRRSAQEFDAGARMGLDEALRFWRHLLPSATSFWNELLPWPTCVSLLIQVHRVDGLEAGSYLLLRDPAHERGLRAQFPAASWEPQASEGLFLMRRGDSSEADGLIACEQPKVGKACFTIAMLADFDSMLSEGRCSAYAKMFWECGAIGQIAYLEAEAAGYRGCGLGCYVDDALLTSLGATGRSWQDLYHFAVGMPVEDGRLRSADPYIHRYRDEDLQ